jgi:hypothetical protein
VPWLGRNRRLAFHGMPPYLRRMRAPPKKSTAKLRNWRVSILRSRAEYLGTVQAADERAAEKAAVEAFALDDDRRRRED